MSAALCELGSGPISHLESLETLKNRDGLAPSQHPS